MSKYPSFLFYYQDFLVGTSFMSLEEIGAYIKLLCFQADRGSLKEEDILKKIPAPIWHAICCKFQKDDNGFFNQRLREEMSKRYKFVESRRKNLHMEAHMVSHMDKAMDAHMDNDNDNDKYIVSNILRGKRVKELKLKNDNVNDYDNNNIIINIILDLNEILKTNYRSATPKIRELIRARLAEGFTLEDFKVVHRKMANAWGLDNKMRQYLRPITLYSNKFESYLNRPDDIANLTPQQQANLKSLAKFNEEMKNGNASVQSGICGIE